MARPVALVAACAASMFACEAAPALTCANRLVDAASGTTACVLALANAHRHWGNAVLVMEAQEDKPPSLCNQCEDKPNAPRTPVTTFCEWCQRRTKDAKEDAEESSAQIARATAAQKAARAGAAELRDATAELTIDFRNSSAVEAMRSSREAIENCRAE